jgi:RNA polymerase sigma-70 factor (ECF subfamily)
VDAAIRKLKPQDREIVMLHAWEELSRPVIAEMMGMSKAAIDQRIHRSYRRLARMLGPVAGTPRPLPTQIAETGQT